MQRRKVNHRLIAQRIRLARELAGMTQQAVASKLFLSQTTISQKERAGNVSAEEIAAFAKLYEVEEEWLRGVDRVEVKA